MFTSGLDFLCSSLMLLLEKEFHLLLQDLGTCEHIYNI
jgi:hypothetical protein